MGNFLQNLANKAQARARQVAAQVNMNDGGRTYQNMRPSSPAPNNFQRVINQINPLDNGRTYKQATPLNTRSIIGQATHSGASNVVGSVAKPLIRSSMALNQGIGNAQVGIYNAFAKNNKPMLNAKQFADESIGRNANRAIDFTGTKRQITGDIVSNVANIALPGSSKIASTAATRLVPKTAPALIQKFAPKVVGGSAAGAVSGVVGNLGGYVADGQPLNLQGALQTAKTGALYGAALGGAAPLALPVAKVASKATVKGAKIVDNRVQQAQQTKIAEQSSKTNLKQLAKQDASLAKRQDALPQGESRQWDLLQRKRDQGQAQAADIQSKLVNRSLADKLLSPNVGMSTQKITNPVDAKHTEYAEALKQMDDAMSGGNKFKANENGSPVMSEKSPFFKKYFAENGKNPTKSDYKEEAIRQLKSGKADEFMQAEYDDIVSPDISKIADEVTKSFSKPEPVVKPVRDYKAEAESFVKKYPDTAASKMVAKQYDLNRKPTPKATAPATPKKQLPPVAKPAPKAPVAKQLPAKSDTTRTRGAIQTMEAGGVKGSKDFTSALKKRDNTYTVRSTSNLQTKAINLVKDNEDAALRVAKNGTDDKAVATSYELIAKYIREDKLEAAIDLAEDIAPKLTEAGRTSQAASIWGKVSTPAGALRFTQRQLDKYNNENGLIKDGQPVGNKQPRTLTPQKAKEITDLAGEIQKLPEGEAKARKIAELTGKMNSVAPTPLLTKLTNIWRAGLLTSLRTLEGGIIGNTAKLALDLPAQTVAAGVDKFVTAPLLNKGQRSNALTLRGRTTGGVSGAKKGAEYLKTGIDPRDIGRGYDTKKMNLEDGSKIINTLGKGAEYVYRAMGTIDNPFYYSALKASRREQAVLEATNKGLKGIDRAAYIKADKLTTKGEELAANDALRAVFQNDTSLGTIAAKFKNAPQGIKDPQSRAAAQAAMDILVPFVKIPSAVATALVDYSPVGLVAEIAKQGFRKELDIRNLNNAIGKATVGTAGGIFIGAKLYASGNLTLEEPQDTNERQLWALEGKQPFSVKIDGKWRKLNYVQPIGSLMAVGGGFSRAKSSGENPYVASIASGLKAVSDQSFLTGVKNAMDAIQAPERGAQRFANSTASSLVPNFIRDLARATDPLEREVNSIGEALKNGIPGLRKQNLPQRDPFGKAVERKQSPLGVMADPFKSTTDKTDSVTSEIRRLYEIDRDNIDFKAAPSKLTKQQTFGGEKVILTPKQLDNFEATVGPLAYGGIVEVMKTDDFKASTDLEKSKTIKKIISDSRKGAKPDFAAANELKDKKGEIVTPKFKPEKKPVVKVKKEKPISTKTATRKQLKGTTGKSTASRVSRQPLPDVLNLRSRFATAKRLKGSSGIKARKVSLSAKLAGSSMKKYKAPKLYRKTA